MKISRTYQPSRKLKEHIQKLSGRKFILDCGHKLTVYHPWGSNFMVYQSPGRKRLRVICSSCSY